MKFQILLTAVISLALGVNAYWMEDIKHQGLAPFGGANYPVFRNVKDYGAVGDGVTDDTAAILEAMNAPGNRCLQGCASITQTPAVVYFPSGTYLISSSIVTPYYTKMIGDPNNRPVLKATANFQGFGLIDGNPYYTENPNWVSVNVFFREIRNFVIDTTNVAPGTAATGIHWPTSQATSLYNIHFNMPATDDTVHVGLFIESGSGGFMSDLSFYGGASGASMGNQQYTMRNLSFLKCKTAITQIWNWGWTYINLSIESCNVGIDMTASDVGSVTVIDSTITGTETFIKSNYTENGTPDTAGSLMLENIKLDTVAVAVKGPAGTLLEGGSKTIAAWGQGHKYTPEGPAEFQGPVEANQRPAALLNGDVYYQRSKPQYENLSATDFLSARSAGAVGDGKTDDTAAIQAVITQAASSGKVVYLDYGLYVVTDTINVPAGSKIVGETYAVIMGSGAKFQDMSAPRPIFKVGAQSGAVGRVEFSDFIVSTKGPAAGAIIVEYNLAAPVGEPSGFWDFHVRVGGYSGSEFQVEQCLKAKGSANIDPNCIASYMAVHATKQSSGLLMENTWIWTADHDIEDPENTQITIFSGRGIYIESEVGSFWLVGGASEHFHLYNYQFANTKSIFCSMLQTETPYYQPLPDAIEPFPVNAALNDPDFATSCNGVEGNCADAWGLRIIDSSDIMIYGSGHYSFFNNYDLSCNTFENGFNCQSRMVSLEGNISNVNIYCLNIIGTESMINRDGTSLAKWQDNVNVFPANIMLFRSG